MSMPPAKRPGLEHCPLIPLCLPLDADSTPSARQATRDENEGRSSAHARPRASSYLDSSLVPAICGDPSSSSGPTGGQASSSSTSCSPFASSLELARLTYMQCLVGTTPIAYHCCWRSCIPRQQVAEEELVNKKFFLKDHLPSELIMRARNSCLSPATSSVPSLFACL
jgi:hypothetical protein